MPRPSHAIRAIATACCCRASARFCSDALTPPSPASFGHNDRSIWADRPCAHGGGTGQRGFCGIWCDVADQCPHRRDEGMKRREFIALFAAPRRHGRSHRWGHWLSRRPFGDRRSADPCGLPPRFAKPGYIEVAIWRSITAGPRATKTACRSSRPVWSAGTWMQLRRPRSRPRSPPRLRSRRSPGKAVTSRHLARAAKRPDGAP